MEQILHYFPDLTDTQRAQMAALEALYTEWNAKINVISRRDIGGLYERHVLHSLAIARLLGPMRDGTEAPGSAPSLSPGMHVVDVGCGGGMPGIPLAIMYPGCDFLLVDRVGKKLKVVEAVAEGIGLANVRVAHAGIEEVKEVADYAVSRAVMPLPDLLKAVGGKARLGLITLKGGDLSAELSPAICRSTRVVPISRWFGEGFFATKCVTYTPLPVRRR